MKDLQKGGEEGGESRKYTKKEQLLLSREREKLEKNLSGIRNIVASARAAFVIDSKKEKIAANEANKLGLRIVGLWTTNADHDLHHGADRRQHRFAIRSVE